MWKYRHNQGGDSVAKKLSNWYYTCKQSRRQWEPDGDDELWEKKIHNKIHEIEKLILNK